MALRGKNKVFMGCVASFLVLVSVALFAVPAEVWAKSNWKWGKWEQAGGKWVRPIVGPSSKSDKNAWFVDMDGFWFSRSKKGGALAAVNVPEWFPGGVASGGAGGFSSSQQGDPHRSFSWGNWTRLGGVWYRGLVEPGPAREGRGLFVDLQGNVYSRVVMPDAPMKSTFRPDWYTGLPPGVTLTPCLDAPGPDGRFYELADWQVFKGVKYRFVVMPCTAQGEGQYYVDGKGRWYRLEKGMKAPEAVGTPVWAQE